MRAEEHRLGVARVESLGDLAQGGPNLTGAQSSGAWTTTVSPGDHELAWESSGPTSWSGTTAWVARGDSTPVERRATIHPS